MTTIYIISLISALLIVGSLMWIMAMFPDDVPNMETETFLQKNTFLIILFVISIIPVVNTVFVVWTILNAIRHGK